MLSDRILGPVVKRARDPVHRQIALNRTVAKNWSLFADHRRRVTDLIRASRGDAPGPLYVLGAGNCNDLDLPRLATAYDEIHLVDLDLGALRAGVRRQAASGGRIHCHRVDLSGVASSLRRWTVSSPSNVDIDRCLFRLEDGAERRWPGRAAANVVASTGLLSQMTGMAIRTLGVDHPRAFEVALAIRDAHLSHLAQILEPNGTGVVITDITSSGTVGSLDRVDRSGLLALTERLADLGDVTTGTNPLGIEASLRMQPENLAVTHVTRHEPWVWNLTPTKAELMVAISFRRADGRDGT